MYQIELAGACFRHDREQVIVFWCASKQEYASLHEFICACWRKAYGEGDCGSASLGDRLEDVPMEPMSPEELVEKLHTYTDSLAYAEIQFPANFTHGVRVIKEQWNEVLYAGESEYDYMCFWWYTTA